MRILPVYLYYLLFGVIITKAAAFSLRPGLRSSVKQTSGYPLPRIDDFSSPAASRSDDSSPEDETDDNDEDDNKNIATSSSFFVEEPAKVAESISPNSNSSLPSSAAAVEEESPANTSEERDIPKKTSSILSSETEELWEALRDASVDVSVSLLKGLRWGLARTLTASLPAAEKKVLLERLQPAAATSDTTTSEMEGTEEDSYSSRGSVAEEAAAADIQQADQETKSDTFVRQLEQELKDAAAARVKGELEIQQYQIQQEKAVAQMKNLQIEKEVLERQVQDLKKSLSEWNTQEEVATGERREKITAAQNELDSIEDLLQKRLEQQAQLETVEKDLQSRAEQIQQTKARLENAPLVPHLSPKEYRSLSKEQKEKLKAKREAQRVIRGDENVSLERPNAKIKDHPVLGPAVTDLGYKRVHLVSAGKLGTIPIWKKQRTFRNSRARLMATEKKKSMNLGFPGIICLYEDLNGRLSILDGQHRVGMMQALQQMRNEEMKRDRNRTNAAFQNQEDIFGNVLVEVYPQFSNSTVNTEAQAEQIFSEINKAEPLKFVDMPGVATAADRKIISEAVTKLQLQFPKMFTPSQRCRVPNVNIDNLRNAIFGANVLRRHNLTTGNELLAWILVQNSALGAKYESDESHQRLVSAKAWAKATRNGFYLGLENSWFYL